MIAVGKELESANSAPQVRRALWSYVVLSTEIDMAETSIALGFATRRRWRRLWWRRGMPDVEQDRRLLDQTYWHYRILLARADGELPAWEGIRIVRERVKAIAD